MKKTLTTLLALTLIGCVPRGHPETEAPAVDYSLVCETHSNLQVDHIYPFSLLLQDGKIATTEQAAAYSPLWNLANGRTMCETCHRKTETYGRQRKVK